MSKLQPLKDKVILEKAEAIAQTKSGIVLPDNAKEKPRTAKVIAVGPGRLLDNGNKEPMEVKVGDIVYYEKFSGSEVKIDEKEYVIISEKDILAIVK
jgi:chaperonin GroES